MARMANINITVFFLAVGCIFVALDQMAHSQESHYPQATVSPAEVADWPAPKLTDNASRYAQALKRISSRSGKAPTLAELRHLLMEPSTSLSRAEYSSLIGVFLRMQHPQLSFGAIRHLRSSLRDTIASANFEWEVELGPHADKSIRAGKYRFLMDSGKLMYEQKTGPKLSKLLSTYLRSYDGTTETVYNADVVGGQAVVGKLVSPSYYFQWHNPLWLAKVIDSQKHLGRSGSGKEMENLDDRWAYPLEGLVEFHGRMCVVLLEQEDVFFLDPSMNYAYCGLEAGRYEFDDKLGRLVSDDSYRTEALDDFQDCGNSLWLPRKAVDTTYKDGSPINVNTVRVLKLSVNEPIDKEHFENVVPKGVEVISGLNGPVRVVGEASPQAALDSAIQARNGRGFRAIVITVNLCLLALCIGLLCYRRFRRRSA